MLLKVHKNRALLRADQRGAGAATDLQRLPTCRGGRGPGSCLRGHPGHGGDFAGPGVSLYLCRRWSRPGIAGIAAGLRVIFFIRFMLNRDQTILNDRFIF